MSAIQELRGLFDEAKERPKLMMLFLAGLSLLAATVGLLFVVMVAAMVILSIMGLLPEEEKKPLPAYDGPRIVGVKPKGKSPRY